ncbi:TniQ family protein [Paraburkholderia hospita]|uniref:TniQ family protein n=1 Tax=Paraburkholderia hospita TaxID=169430 RepID=UPI0002719C41|nr:TniQ family protein [Paraburkholderia hospita]EUC18705.1 hypothetical protein PMI06_003081 [Burkholderia sp. BT03]SKC62375.1 TniQ protein [Paraburkholderia hospita]
MAIALFPLLDGETIGNNIARYGEFIGAENTFSLRRRLFGYPCKPDTRLPSGLKHLAEQTRDYWNLEPAEIIRRNTEFYYATATVPVTRREKMFSDMLELPGSRCLRRSASGWTGERVSKFRYCEDCLSEWRAMGMPAQWLVDHQLPGVYACSLHSSMLKVAKRSPPGNLTDSTLMALKGPEDEGLLAGASSSERGAIKDVASLSVHYRLAKGSLPSSAAYRELLRVTGYMWRTGGVDIRAVTTSILENFGREYCHLVGLSLEKITTWLNNISDEKKDGEPSHPLMFIAMESLLNRRCASPGMYCPANHGRMVDSNSPASDKCSAFDQSTGALSRVKVLHRINSAWECRRGERSSWKLIFSCRASYPALKMPVEGIMRVAKVDCGGLYQWIMDLSLTRNINLSGASQNLSVKEAEFLRWTHYTEFAKRRELTADEIQCLREKWRSLVLNARPERRITSAYRGDSRLYRTLCRHDREWFTKFNSEHRTRLKFSSFINEKLTDD